MDYAKWVCAIFCAGLLPAGETMHVAICNPGHFSDATVRGAEAETGAIFQHAGVDVVWAKCGSGPVSEQAAIGHWFTIRLRGDKAVAGEPGLASPAIMGRAFVSGGQPGYLADVYVEAVRAFSAQTGANDRAAIGCVMAHELGHLLLGPGHEEEGIMRAPWSRTDAAAITQRWLRFNWAENARIRQALDAEG